MQTDTDVCSLPVQLYFKGDNMVNILQHVGHCGIWCICYTRQRHRVPPAHLNQTWTHKHKHTQVNDPLWKHSKIDLLMSLPLCASVCVACTFGLCGRAVRVAQCQQGHLYQLVKQQVSLDQHKLSVFFCPLSLQRAFPVLHHTEYWQQASWSDPMILYGMTFDNVVWKQRMNMT